jgi:hypothetical protein
MEIIQIVNHYKLPGQEGLYLNLWNTQQQEWTTAYNTYHDAPELVRKHNRKYKLTLKKMGYTVPPK